MSASEEDVVVELGTVVEEGMVGSLLVEAGVVVEIPNFFREFFLRWRELQS